MEYLQKAATVLVLACSVFSAQANDIVVGYQTGVDPY